MILLKIKLKFKIKYESFKIFNERFVCKNFKFERQNFGNYTQLLNKNLTRRYKFKWNQILPECSSLVCANLLTASPLKAAFYHWLPNLKFNFIIVNIMNSLLLMFKKSWFVIAWRQTRNQFRKSKSKTRFFLGLNLWSYKFSLK